MSNSMPLVQKGMIVNMATSEFIKLLFACIVAFVITLVSTPIVKKLAFKWKAIDVPKDGRRMHKNPIPRLGGLAIIFGFAVSVVLFGIMTREILAILCGAFIIAVMGIVDDIKSLDAKPKFFVQIIAALIVVLTGNMKISVITNPNIFSDIPYLILPDWLSIIVSIVWIVFITNAVNFIDGLDGLAAGVSAIMSVSLTFIAVRLGEYYVAVVSVALMGACFGFLPYNFNPAKIFMGDTGSTFLGFILASLSINGVFKSYAIISFAVPVLMLGLPLFDASFAMIRRLLRGESPMKADRGHLHHRLIDMGFSQKQSVFILYVISGVLGLSAIVLAEAGTLRAVLLLLFILVILLTSFLVFKVEHKTDDTKYISEKDEEDAYEQN